MSVSVSMPQLGESVTEGTVTRWLKREGEHVDADEPLLEVSTDKVDTEIPSPVSGVLRGITVAEDETVAVGAQLAVIDEEGSAGGAADAGEAAPADSAQSDSAQSDSAQSDSARSDSAQPDSAPAAAEPAAAEPAAAYQPQAPAAYQSQPAYQYQSGYQAQPAYPQPPAYQPQPGYQQPTAPAQQPTTNPYQQAAPEATSYQPAAPAYQSPAVSAPPQGGHPYQGEVAPSPYGPEPTEPDASGQDSEGAEAGGPGAGPAEAGAPGAGQADAGGPGTGGTGTSQANGAESPYVTPLVRKLAADHGIDLATVAGTGVGGRIRKQDVLDAARSARPGAPAADQSPQAQFPQAPSQQAPSPQAQSPQAPAEQAPAAAGAPGQAQAAPPAQPAGERRPARPPVAESSLRGTTERMSRARQVIAQRMVESLQTSAQLTTVVEADVTAIARLRNRAKAAFEAREGVRLSFLPFFALAVVESLKAHPKLNSVIDTATGQVTYHDAEHLGIAVDTERGLMVPVIRNAGDLNIGGLARKIADLAERTRAGHVSPDDLAGGTFTLTNTGSRGALFDTPIINQPQVGILGTGTVVKRAVVVEDPALGEVITVRSMVYLALTYDHRIVDGADAARFLTTLKARLEEGAFETEFGL
jgi:pyruvate dehydrogenase E2 component (dihydrolipoamide acetyltransferase)